MAANPSRRDRWPSPRHVRHVWLIHPQRHQAPSQGLIIDWKNEPAGWEALVAYVVETTEGQTDRLIQEWIPAARLRPLSSKPDDLHSDPGPY